MCAKQKSFSRRPMSAAGRLDAFAELPMKYRYLCVCDVQGDVANQREVQIKPVARRSREREAVS
jgi:hypothetical protein